VATQKSKERAMATVVELTAQEITELMALTKAGDASAAVRSAMTEYLRFARRLQLKATSGKVRMADNWQALEAAELGKGNGNS
jgi:hypothetical protein